MYIHVFVAVWGRLWGWVVVTAVDHRLPSFCVPINNFVYMQIVDCGRSIKIL